MRTTTDPWNRLRASRQPVWLWVILVVLSLVFAWLVGFYREQEDLTGFLAQVLPQAHRFERRTDRVYVGYVRLSSSNRTTTA